MKLAVACDGSQVSGHFGHCESFLICEVENGNLLRCESFASPGHDSGSLPNFLQEKGASLVISGGMGEGAQKALKQRNIEVLTGASGDALQAVRQYLKGELVSIPVSCTHDHGHEHHHHE
ncbi:NifB/NifX family molybdenum-iron cluster-binding protein [Oscillospiraceae bacterium MB08-C2-2]|nr:NifB/NifX family molybdenum-iron cluster-binding protein [Oscillospiraceae bacterium MB08-C2-2]